jgi:hypothetical protein
MPVMHFIHRHTVTIQTIFVCADAKTKLLPVETKCPNREAFRDNRQLAGVTIFLRLLAVIYGSFSFNDCG